MLTLAACSPVGILNAMAPRAGVVVHRDIAYEPGPRHALDIYVPARPVAATPVVVFFYGGGWDSGDRGMYRFVGAALAAHGVLTVVPDYRLYPEVRFPSFMRDAAAAVAWTRDHATSYGGDAQRLFLMGHSAGAQIATLLALDGRYLRSAGVDPGACRRDRTGRPLRLPAAAQREAEAIVRTATRAAIVAADQLRHAGGAADDAGGRHGRHHGRSRQHPPPGRAPAAGRRTGRGEALSRHRPSPADRRVRRAADVPGAGAARRAAVHRGSRRRCAGADGLRDAGA